MASLANSYSGSLANLTIWVSGSSILSGLGTPYLLLSPQWCTLPSSSESRAGMFWRLVAQEGAISFLILETNLPAVSKLNNCTLDSDGNLSSCLHKDSGSGAKYQNISVWGSWTLVFAS